MIWAAKQITAGEFLRNTSRNGLWHLNTIYLQEKIPDLPIEPLELVSEPAAFHVCPYGIPDMILTETVMGMECGIFRALKQTFKGWMKGIEEHKSGIISVS